GIPIRRETRMNWRLAQDPAYHQFADSRTFLGIANAGDTLSNLAILVAGLMGLAFIWREYANGSSRRFVVREEMRAYAVLFAAVAITGFGSAWYHLAPNDLRLVWDRLPMSFSFTALLAVTIAERIRLTVGLRILVPLLLLGGASVGWWHATGNLLPYAAVQYGSIAMILAIVMKFRSRYTHGNYILGVLAIYAAAKAAEAFDSQIFAIVQIASGHTLKHLLAAAAVLWLLRILQLRRPQ
ncbi:MAG TPA: ceramidase domain-containing protein, partial [Burkholderiales bacterium]